MISRALSIPATWLHCLTPSHKSHCLPASAPLTTNTTTPCVVGAQKHICRHVTLHVNTACLHAGAREGGPPKKTCSHIQCCRRNLVPTCRSSGPAAAIYSAFSASSRSALPTLPPTRAARYPLEPAAFNSSCINLHPTQQKENHISIWRCRPPVCLLA